jgi:hypothetical protein
MPDDRTAMDAELHTETLPPEAEEQNRYVFRQLADTAAELLDYPLEDADRERIVARAVRATKDFHYGDLVILGALLKHAGERGMAAKADEMLCRGES